MRKFIIPGSYSRSVPRLFSVWKKQNTEQEDSLQALTSVHSTLIGLGEFEKKRTKTARSLALDDTHIYKWIVRSGGQKKKRRAIFTCQERERKKTFRHSLQPWTLTLGKEMSKWENLLFTSLDISFETNLHLFCSSLIGHLCCLIVACY